MKQKQDVEKIIDELTLFNDNLMSLVFSNNLEATNLILRILLNNPNIVTIDVIGQKELKSPLINGRSIRLDIYAKDENNRYFDVEIQRSRSGASLKRARFYSAMLDTRMLKEGESFSDLKDSYVIFFAEVDFFGKGLPLYHIHRTILETEDMAQDGSYILYVNGEYEGKDSIGLLIHDFHCKKVSEIHYPELRKGIKHFKEEGGRTAMSDIVLEFAKEYAEEATLAKMVENIKSIMKKLNLSLDQAIEALDISEEEQKKIRPLLH